MGSCLDLRKFQDGGDNHDSIKSALGKLLSGKDGYVPVTEKKEEQKKVLRCNCGWVLAGGEKFCPECGTKMGLK